ncbi:ATP-binding protein [Chitinophaga sp. XS-30]|uniref:AAA family ATPase n=1 Tax=Chitinophaga sp. XS-30 TaxID=2604421 RepID=UPI0011DCEF6E|nr:ATP-binding protein [Chitinophaga sp. XS-30]QEH39717.1 AAA family ATPase [Chitinophaga sp. XS-30]
MAETIIGRDAEKKMLKEMLSSKEAELIAILGRRRVGKTFLVRNYYQKYLVFECTGIHEARMSEQLFNFTRSLQQAMQSPIPPATPDSWVQAFTFLSDFLATRLKDQPAVVLFDEFPWIHTAKSGFLTAFGHWWNTWASRQPQLKVVICGSAASWMIENILHNKGGLHNRVSRTIQLLPFSLKESEDYLISRGVKLDHYQILQLYMAMGGIPQYLKQVDKGQSAQQVIDKLFFEKNGMLKTEFNVLYRSLFNNASHHEAIVRELAKKASGLSRAEVIKACGLTTGGTTTRLFEELEQSGFITQYIPFEKTSRDGIYKLSDEYSLFYLKFIDRARAAGAGTWHKIAEGQSYNSWSGYAFEAICQKHIQQIKKALGIAAVYTEASGWRYMPKKGETGAQIDLLLDRADHSINVCEMKFAHGEFVIDKKYANELDSKVKVFQAQTRTRKTIFPTMITTYGTKQNIYYTGRIVSEVKMEDLFR